MDVSLKVELPIRLSGLNMFLFCLFLPVALVQPSVGSSQDAVKDSPFGAMIPPTSTIPGSFMPSAIPGAGVFNPVGVQTQQAANEKTQSAEGMDATAELTLQGDTSLMCLNSFISSIHFYVSFF